MRRRRPASFLVAHGCSVFLLAIVGLPAHARAQYPPEALVVRHLRITGNEYISDQSLRSAIATSQSGFMARSVYGAAGSLVIFLVWVYYSALLVFFGTELTHVWARCHGRRFAPVRQLHGPPPRGTVELITTPAPRLRDWDDVGWVTHDSFEPSNTDAMWRIDRECEPADLAAVRAVLSKAKAGSWQEASDP